MTELRFHSAVRAARHGTMLLAIGSLVACARSHSAHLDRISTSTLGATATSPNQLTSEERTAGWVLLFDGQTLEGWRGLGYPSIPPGHWTVVDGAIKKI